MKKLWTLVLVLCLAFSLTACDGSGVSPDGGAAGGEAEHASTGFELTAVLASEPDTLDPAQNWTTDGATYILHMFEGLMKQGKPEQDGGAAEIVCGQAESYDISEDGLTYTFKLRDDIFWSDGEPVTAGDFVYAWRRLVDPQTASYYGYLLDMVENGAAIYNGELDPEALGISAPDERTVVVRLHTPCAYFLEICANFSTVPVREDLITQLGDAWATSPDTYVSNGPYKMSEWAHDSYIKCVPNEYYYGVEALGPDTITFRLMDDNNAMLAGYNSGEIDFLWSFPTDELPGLIESGQVSIVPNLGCNFISFNTAQTPFKDARVREALSLAIDRDYIVEFVSQGGETPAAALVPPGIGDAPGSANDFRTVGGDYFSLTADDYAKNCEEARSLLAEAGYPGGKNFPLIKYIFNTADLNQTIAEAVAYMWQTELGIATELSNMDWNVYLDTRSAGDYDAAKDGWSSDYSDAMAFVEMFVTNGTNNPANYLDAGLDQLAAAAKMESDLGRRAELMHQAEDRIMEEAVIAPLYFYTNVYMLQDTIRGMYYSPLGLFFFSYCQEQ